MIGRRVEPVAIGPAARRWPWFALAGVALLALGIGVGSRISSRSERVVVQTVTGGAGPTPTDGATAYAQTRMGAVAAATNYLTAISGRTLLDPARLQDLLGRIATTKARPQLASVYATAANEARRRLGFDANPRPSIVLRVSPVGYRVSAFTDTDATVLLWRVGLVASSAGVPPQQVWTTETVRLSWEGGTWKVADLTSSPGPTPPLIAAVTPTADLATAIPAFEEFTDATP